MFPSTFGVPWTLGAHLQECRSLVPGLQEQRVTSTYSRNYLALRGFARKFEKLYLKPLARWNLNHQSVHDCERSLQPKGASVYGKCSRTFKSHDCGERNAKKTRKMRKIESETTRGCTSLSVEPTQPEKEVEKGKATRRH